MTSPGAVGRAAHPTSQMTVTGRIWGRAGKIAPRLAHPGALTCTSLGPFGSQSSGSPDSSWLFWGDRSQRLAPGFGESAGLCLNVLTCSDMGWLKPDKRCSEVGNSCLHQTREVFPAPCCGSALCCLCFLGHPLTGHC